jgi:hypothetical protein
VAGGIGALMVTGLWSVIFPSLRSVDDLSSKSLRAGQNKQPEPSQT